MAVDQSIPISNEVSILWPPEIGSFEKASRTGDGKSGDAAKDQIRYEVRKA